MSFNSKQELYGFLKNYAKQRGFGISKKSVKKEDDGQKRYYSLTCNKYGKRRTVATSCIFNSRPSIKTGCKAKINVRVNNEGTFTIFGVSLEHNYALSPNKSRFFRCNKAMDSHVKKRLEVNDEVGISLSRFNKPKKTQIWVCKSLKVLIPRRPVLQPVDLRDKIWLCPDNTSDAEAFLAFADEEEPVINEALVFDDLADATHFGSSGDRIEVGYTEAEVGLEKDVHHNAVAKLEDLQWKNGTEEENQWQKEQRQLRDVIGFRWIRVMLLRERRGETPERMKGKERL
ncbi:hypothetical protein SLEP1_g49644 [Rubroshorea leprosula]|uniref:FAR1 domain-containing protein n=1 Tax=Rubroshorea leprosula TaxID=152421 RepID=A0AAV5M0Q7_9ROSI|nr:hypothetical protein SLEP1_g49644 [Rubroshorea leprosula]